MRSRLASERPPSARPGPGRRLGAFSALLLAAGLAIGASEIAETREALDEIVERLNALDTWFSDAEKKRVRWLQEVRNKDTEVAEVSRRVDRAAAAVDEVRAELKTLQQEQSRLQSQRAVQARRIGDHLAAAYRMSGQDFVKLLLNQESPETFDRMMRYHRYFSEVRMAALADYEQTLAALERNRVQLVDREAEASSRQEALRVRQVELEAEREERKQLLVRLEAEAEDKNAQRDRLSADRERLESLLAELLRRSQTLDGRAFAERKGGLTWPVTGRILHGFGQPRADGRLAWHGIMISAAEGTEIQAVFRGRVVFADWLRGFGLLTILDHGGGYMTLYGNADLLTKKVGDWVESGETVAQAGRSGGQTSSGLYFEVRQNGEARDPVVWLGKR